MAKDMTTSPPPGTTPGTHAHQTLGRADAYRFGAWIAEMVWNDLNLSTTLRDMKPGTVEIVRIAERFGEEVANLGNLVYASCLTYGDRGTLPTEAKRIPLASGITNAPPGHAPSPNV